MISYSLYNGEGEIDIKATFVKNEEGDEYGDNKVYYTYIVNGKIKRDLLMYILVYNADNELVIFKENIISKAKYFNSCFTNFFNLPYGETISKILIKTMLDTFYADR